MSPVGEAHAPRLIVSVTEIRRRLGSRMPITRLLPAEGLALSDVAVPDGADIAFSGDAESIENGVVLTGTVQVPWEGSCRRCLEPVTGTAELAVREIYEARPVDGETWPLEGDHIDLGPLLHDSALLALPLAPLCRDDCAGPAPDQFPATVEPDPAEQAVEGPPKDPRWAALDALDLPE